MARRIRQTDYEAVNAKIIEQLNNGVRPWVKSHNGGAGGMPLRSCGTPYRGMNVIMLWLCDFDNPYWLTHNKIEELGGSKKGIKSPAFVTYADTVVRETDEGDKTYFSFSKLTHVWNASQVIGLPEKYYNKNEVFSNPDERLMDIDAKVANTGATIKEKDCTPSYTPALDVINMPYFHDFKTGGDYYSVLFHELAHWSGAKSRLDRLDLKNRKGYAFEELVAEISAAYLMAHLKLDVQVRDDHAEYIGAWLSALDDDHKYVFDAARVAQKAADFIIDKMNSEHQLKQIA